MRMLRLLAAALVAAFLAALVPGPAWAHNSLTKAVPDRNATLDEAPESVTLTFLQRVDPAALTIRVTDAGQREVAAGPAEADGRTGTVAFAEPPPNGTYTVTYRVVSLDGHPVEGSYRFTVDDPAAAPAPAPSPETPSAAPGRSSAGPAPSGTVRTAVVPLAGRPGDSRSWFLAAGVAALAVAGLAAVLVLRRRRT